MGWVLHRQINKIWILHDFENDLNILEYPFWNVTLFSYPSLWMGVVIIGIQLYIYFLVWPRKIWPDYLGGGKYGQGVGNVNANGEYCWKGWASAKRGQVYKGICVEKMKKKMIFMWLSEAGDEDLRIWFILPITNWAKRVWSQLILSYAPVLLSGAE